LKPVVSKSVCPGIREERATGYRDGIEGASEFVVSPGTEECSAVNYILCQQPETMSDGRENILLSFGKVPGCYVEIRDAPREVCSRRWDIREEVSLLPKAGRIHPTRGS